LITLPASASSCAAVLNAASNALNQIYDLEIDRINKPATARCHPAGCRSGRLGVHGCGLRRRVGAGLDRSSSRPARVLLDRRGRHRDHGSLLSAPFRTKRLGIWANVTIAIRGACS